MRSLVLLLAVTAVCVAFGYASVVLREVEERLSSEQLRAELGLGSDFLPDHALVQVELSDPARTRRDAGEEVAMTMNVLGHNVTVDLKPNNDLLPKSYVLQTVGEDGTLRTLPSHVRRGCYYTGRVEGSEGSHVAVQMCKGEEMNGVIMSEGHAVVVKPMKNSSLHLVYDATETIVSSGPVDEVESSRPIEDARRMAKSIDMAARRKRQSSGKETMEMMVYVDKQTADYHGAANVEAYVATVLNVFASLYNDPSLLGPPVYVALVRLIVETGSTSPISSSANVNDLLTSFCDYQVSGSFPSDDTNPQHHDFAIFLSRRDIFSVDSAGKQQLSTIGFAPVGTMCNNRRSCGLVQDQGTASAFTMAHEAGHVFNMQHDGLGNDCNPSGNIMASRLVTGPGLFKWSSCSASYLEQYRGRGLTQCLRDAPGGSSTSVNANTLPGRGTSATEQCRKSRGPSSTPCSFSQTPDQFCRQLYCRGTDNLCYSQLPLEGTRCDTGKSCYEGSCVADSLLNNPINGQWGAWSAFSSCSRTCGGGVRTRTRECNNPAPQYGGRYCEGKSYDVQYCNPNACDGDTYRNEQCAATNNDSFNGQLYTWTEFDNARVGAPPCDLVCLSSGNFYSTRGVVADGTSCRASNGYDKAICVRGSCMNVGCDDTFDGAQEDRCGVCNGDGSSCSTVARTFSSTNQPFGYRPTITIPVGARDVVIREDPVIGNNYFALSVSGTRVLNANFRVTTRSNFNAAGAAWAYQRGSTSETLSTNGPLTQEANFEVLVGANGNNVRFTYEYSVASSTTQPPTTQPPTTRSPTTQPPTTRPPTTQPPTTRPPTTQPPTTRPPTTQPPTTRPPTTQPPTTRPPTTQPPTTRPPTTQPPTTQPPTTRPPTTQPPTTRPPTTQPPTTRPPTTQPPTTRPPTTRPPTTQPPTTRPPTTQPSTTSSCSSSCTDQYTICTAYKRYCSNFQVVRDLCCRTCNCA